MTYTVTYSKNAIKELSKLNPHIRDTIFKWIDKNLTNCENPRLHGKALSGNLSGLWRYRIGDYRVIAEIQDEQVIILILEIGHRKSVYD